MKKFLYGAAALALLTACGGGGDKPPKIDASPEDIAAALADMSLDSSEAGLVRFAGSKVSDGSATFDGFSVMLDEDEELELTAAKLTVDGLHMSDQGANFVSMKFEDMKLTDGDERATLTLADLTIDQPSPALSAWMADLMNTGEPGDFPALSDVSFKGVTFGDMKFVASEDDDVDVNFGFSTLALTDFAQGGLGNLSFDDMAFSFVNNYDGSDVSGSLGSYDLDGLKQTQAEVLETVFKLADDEDAMVEQIGDLIGSNLLDPGYDRSVLKNLKLNINGLNIDLPSLEQTADYNRDGKAVASETKPFKLTVNVDPAGQMGAQAQPIMEMLELESLVLSGAGKTKINPDGDSFEAAAKDNYLEVENLMKLSLGTEMSGLSSFYSSLTEAAAQGADEDEAMLAAASNLNIGGLELALRDDGVFEKGLNLAGTMMGQDPQALRFMAMAGVAALPSQASEIGIEADLAAELSGALQTFLQEQGTLTLKLDPAEPLTMQSFMDPSAITKDSLGFSATAD